MNDTDFTAEVLFAAVQDIECRKRAANIHPEHALLVELRGMFPVISRPQFNMAYQDLRKDKRIRCGRTINDYYLCAVTESE